MTNNQNSSIMKPQTTLHGILKIYSFALALRGFILVALGLAIIASAPFTRAADVTWVAGNGSLNTAANWSSSPALPGVSDNVFFNGAGYNISATASMTNAAAFFTNNAAGAHYLQIGAGNTWRLTNGLTVRTTALGSWQLESGTVAVTNASGTAVAAFGGGSDGGRPNIAGGTLRADILTYTNSTVNRGLVVDYGELTVLHGSSVSNAPSDTSIIFGNTGGQAAAVNILGGSNTWFAESLQVGGSGRAVVTVNGAGTTFTHSGVLLALGRASGSVSNTLTVNGGAVMTANETAGVVLGYEATASENTLMVEGVGSRFEVNTGNVNVGRKGSNNSIIISNGGVMTINSSNQPIYLGEQSAAASGNLLLVTGAGSRFETAATGDNSYIGVGMKGNSNRFEVTDGGAAVAYRLYVGLSGGLSNTVVIKDGGSLRILDQISTSQGGSSGNTITVSNRGILEFTKNAPSINVDGGAITIGDGGVVSFTGISNAPTGGLSGLTYSGNSNGLRLNNATNASVANYTFKTGTPGTYAQLDLVGASQWNGTTLTISNGGRLVGEGIINATTTVADGGILAIGHSPGTMTFNNDLTLNSGSTSEFEINGFSGGQFDLAQGGSGTQTVTFNGTLALVFQSGFAINGTVKIFDFENYAGSFTNVNATGLAGGYTASFNALTGQVTVVPEPSTAALALLGVGALLWRLCARRGSRV